MLKIKEGTKKMLKAMTTKKGILALVLFAAPIIGIAVSPEYAASLAEHLSIILEHVLDLLPTEDVPAE